MNRLGLAAVCLTGAFLLAGITACSPSAPPEPPGPPAWAYPPDTPAAPPSPPDPTPRHLDGSAASFTMAQLKDRSSAPDWRPDEHPPMPDVVVHGRKPDVLPCGFCHLPSGDGRPENASLAGLPRDYIIKQMADFKSGARGSSVARTPPKLMTAIAKAATDEEVIEAANYFAALTPRSFTEVIEADQAPKTHVAGWVLAKDTAGGTEPLGERIVEIPEEFERFEMRDGHLKYLAYAPKGSLAKGKNLVALARGPEKHPCADCHGEDFRGVGNVPRLAGRSPGYITRQLYDFRSGARAGANAEKMKPIVANLGQSDMIAIAAYLASLAP